MSTAIRIVRPSDLAAVQALSSKLFPWQDVDALDLGSCITTNDRWLCLAAAHLADDSEEQLVGFVVAAIGFVREYEADQERLVSWLCALEAAPQEDAGGWTAAATAAAADGTLAVQVCLLGVTERFRRQRVATALVTRTENWARSRGAQLLFLYVDPTEAGALQFYARHGFMPACAVPDYYAPGHEALLLVMPIGVGSSWSDLSDSEVQPTSASSYTRSFAKQETVCWPSEDTRAAWGAEPSTLKGSRRSQTVQARLSAAYDGTSSGRNITKVRCCHSPCAKAQPSRQHRLSGHRLPHTNVQRTGWLQLWRHRCKAALACMHTSAICC